MVSATNVSFELFADVRTKRSTRLEQPKSGNLPVTARCCRAIPTAYAGRSFTAAIACCRVPEIAHEMESVMAEPMNEELRKILESEMAKWVRKRIEALPEKARYRAYNAVRSLVWAGGIATLEGTKYQEGERGYRVPATFMLTHALEEAVTALVMSAKASGYGKLARNVKITDHYHKTTLSWLCAEVVNMLEESRPALSFDPENDRIVLRVKQGEETICQVATLGLLGWRAPDGTLLASLADKVFERHGGEEEVAKIVKDNGSGRNKLIYATNTGFLTGPLDLEDSLRKMAKSTMGVLWATVDIADHKGERAQIMEMILRTTVELKNLAFPPEEKCRPEVG